MGARSGHSTQSHPETIDRVRRARIKIGGGTMRPPRHLALVSCFLGRLIGAALALAAAGFETHAQDLEPRAFANTPVGLNFLIGGYAYAKGTVGTDPSVPLEDTEVRPSSAVLAYVRTLDLWGRSGGSST
jgi:hypothetical protein